MLERSLLLLLLAAPLLSASLSAQDHDVQLAPFNAIRWSSATTEVPEVRVGETWYAWLEIDEVEVGEIVDFCQERWPGRWRKRVGEDLVEAILLMGGSVSSEVTLVVRELLEGKRLELEKVAMTGANRRAVLTYNRAAENGAVPPPPPLVKRVEREHATAVPTEYASLARVIDWAGWRGPPTLTRREAEEDLDQLEWLVEHTHSYRSLRGVDHRAIFDALRAGLDEELPVGAFAIGVSQAIALLGDGHAGVREMERLAPSGFLPFLVADSDGGVVAFRSDREGLVDPERPYVRSIDGRPIDEWLEAVSGVITAASEETSRFRALRRLRHLNYARLELGLELTGEVRAELVAAGGKRSRTITLPLALRKPIYGPWPLHETGRLEGDVGYLRIPSMSSSRGFVEGLVEALDGFADTRALVIDVRGNGGGSRDALLALLPYLMEPEESTRIVNVAAYRLPPGTRPGDPAGYLENRYLYPKTFRDWTAREREAIEALSGRFVPDWRLPEGEFTDWHYFVVSAAEPARRYPGPIYLLLDTGCFSATDIFLGAFAGASNVTLIGTPSGGGSGRSQRSELAHSGLSLRLSSMASFRPDGRRYDGLGIEPDVLIRPRARDFLLEGGDAVLEAALKLARD